MSDPVTYKLNDFNFFATGIWVNRQTGKGSGLFFDYGNMGFNFSRFDNYLPGKEYRLSVRKGQFSTVKGILELQDIKLLPQKYDGEEGKDIYPVFFTGTSYRRAGNGYLKGWTGIFRVASFRVDSPDVQVCRSDGSGMSASLKGLALEGVSWDSTLLKLGSVHMESPVADILFRSFSRYSTKIKRS